MSDDDFGWHHRMAVRANQLQEALRVAKKDEADARVALQKAIAARGDAEAAVAAHAFEMVQILDGDDILSGGKRWKIEGFCLSWLDRPMAIARRYNQDGTLSKLAHQKLLIDNVLRIQEGASRG